eukprot:14555261-Alexandrium_andersonii.AAC.1
MGLRHLPRAGLLLRPRHRLLAAAAAPAARAIAARRVGHPPPANRRRPQSSHRDTASSTRLCLDVPPGRRSEVTRGGKEARAH